MAGKVKRLRQEGALPPRADKHFDVKPVQARPPRPSPETLVTATKRAPILNGTVPGLEVPPCSILELDDSRCRWPLGEVHNGAVWFCGDSAAPGHCYCAHHLRRASSSGSAN